MLLCHSEGIDTPVSYEKTFVTGVMIIRLEVEPMSEIGMDCRGKAGQSVRFGYNRILTDFPVYLTMRAVPLSP